MYKGAGVYFEGFEASKNETASNPYPETDKNHREWENGFTYGSRVCALCNRQSAKANVRILPGNALGFSYGDRTTDIKVKYGIDQDQCICSFCYRQKCPPSEHVVYTWDNWKENLQRVIKFVDNQNAEAPFREIKYYALPTKGRGIHSYIVITNGDRYDIRNPHVSDSADDMVSMTREEILKVIE